MYKYEGGKFFKETVVLSWWIIQSIRLNEALTLET